MDISAGLIAKGTLGTAAAAGAGYLGYNYKDEISSYIFKPKGEELSSDISSANEKLGKLGFGDCKFGKDWVPQGCEGTLNSDKLKAIKFDGKSESNQNTINHADRVTLKIEKTTETSTFPDGIKIIFETNEDVNIPKTSNENITLKKNTNPEFKIKSSGESLSIERAWDINTLSGKIGLMGCTSSSPKQCSLPTNKKINVYLGTENYAVDMDITESDSAKKITYEEDQEGYNQGLKFTVAEDVGLTGGESNKKAGTVEKIEKATSGNPTYEIKEQTIGSEKIWFLSKKA